MSGLVTCRGSFILTRPIRTPSKSPQAYLTRVPHKSYASSSPKTKPIQPKPKLSPKPTIQNTIAKSSTPPTKPNATSPLQQAYTGTTSPLPPLAPSNAKSCPPRILIYHGGTGRTIFLSCFRLTGIFMFIFTAGLISPTYYFSPVEPTWMAFATLAAGAVPLAVLSLSTAPFVTYVHLSLPLWARASQTRLHRYASSLPAGAVLDITTMRWIWPRVTRLRASELYFKQSSVTGSMTLKRNIPKELWEEKKWYDYRPLKSFYVAGRTSKVDYKGLWEEVLECIGKGWSKPGQFEKIPIPKN